MRDASARDATGAHSGESMVRRRSCPFPHVDGVRYGTGILDRGTGRETIGPDGTTPFYAASVIKLFVVTYLLHEHEQGAVVLDDTMTDIDRLSVDKASDLTVHALDP